MRISAVYPDIAAVAGITLCLVGLSEAGLIESVQQYPVMLMVVGYGIGRLVSLLVNRRSRVNRQMSVGN
jgi:hypothetical protein